MGSTQPVGHGSGSDGSREESGVHVSNGGGEVHHPDHMQRQHQLLEHQQRQHLQQQHQHHHQPHHPQQHNYGAAQDQELRTQYRLNAPQSDSSSPPGSPTQPPKLELNPTPPMTTNQRDSVTSQKIREVTNHRQTETEAVSQKEGNEREESGSASSGVTAGAEPANQGTDKDSKLTSGDGHLTEEQRRQKILETVQRELDRETHLHPHHPQQRPKPTTFKTALSTAAPVSSSARRAPFRPASPRRRRKHRKRISKAAIRAMIM